MLLIIFLLAILSLALLYLLPNYRKNETLRPPPGPKGLPFIGNLHHFDSLKPHVYFSELAKIYGPILRLRLGSKRVVVIQSAKLAKEVLQTQDLNFCSRPSLVGRQRLSYNGLNITFSPYGEYFREIKKLIVVHLFSAKRVESFAPIRQKEVARMITKITSLATASEIVNLSDLLMSFTTSNICRTAFGKRYEDNEGSRSRFHSLIYEAQVMFTTFFFSDYFPSIGWLDKLTGKFSRLERTFMDFDVFYEEIINHHLNSNKSESDRDSIINVLLHLRGEGSIGLTLEHIKALLMVIFMAGSDSTTAMVVWAMTELVKNPLSMKKVQDEIWNAMQNNDCINNDDLQELVYFKAVVKETFRLHPAAPLLVAHEAIRKSSIEGYDILPKTIVYVNAWAIGRDLKFWKDPEKFIPERFLGSSVDYKGYDFELIPFGAGRRICPALNLGVSNIELALANLLYRFEWELPPGVKKEDIDTDVLPGITMHKKNPLCLMAKIIKKPNVINS